MPINHQAYNHFQLWQAEVGDDSLNYEADTQAILGHSEVSRLARTTSKSKQREYLLSRAVIRHALSQLYELPLTYWKIKEQIHSAPTIENLPTPIFFSLTHSHGLIQFATSIYPIGIDIERIDPKKDLLELAKLSMNNTELDKLMAQKESQKLVFFYQIWSAKEAYYKAQSKQVQNELIFAAFDISTVLTEQHYQRFDLSNRLYSNIIVIKTKAKPDE